VPGLSGRLARGPSASIPKPKKKKKPEQPTKDRLAILRIILLNSPPKRRKTTPERPQSPKQPQSDLARPPSVAEY